MCGVKFVRYRYRTRKNKNSISPCLQNAKIWTKYCTKAFGGRALPGSAGEITALPQTLSYIKGKEWKDSEGRGKERREGKGHCPPSFRFSGYAHDLHHEESMANEMNMNEAKKSQYIYILLT